MARAVNALLGSRAVGGEDIMRSLQADVAQLSRDIATYQGGGHFRTTPGDQGWFSFPAINRWLHTHCQLADGSTVYLRKLPLPATLDQLPKAGVVMTVTPAPGISHAICVRRCPGCDGWLALDSMRRVRLLRTDADWRALAPTQVRALHKGNGLERMGAMLSAHLEGWRNERSARNRPVCTPSEVATLQVSTAAPLRPILPHPRSCAHGALYVGQQTPAENSCTTHALNALVGRPLLNHDTVLQYVTGFRV